MPLARFSALALLALLLPGAPIAAAAGMEAREPKEVAWSFNGPFGRYDRDALQRGYQVYRQVCASCHGMKQISFRNLGQRGGPFYLEACPEGFAENVDCANPNDNPLVKQIASEFVVTDGPDDAGEMFERPGLPADRLPAPYPNEQRARMMNGGALPPDLSLIVKARANGANYIYSLLSGFEPAPETVDVPATQFYNPYFPGDMSQLLRAEYRDEEGHAREGVHIPEGGVLAMAPPLSDGLIDYADPATPETVDQYTKDVVQFLTWASEPKMEQRKKLGFMTVAYLLVLAGLLYWSYRSIWAKIDH